MKRENLSGGMVLTEDGEIVPARVDEIATQVASTFSLEDLQEMSNFSKLELLVGMIDYLWQELWSIKEHKIIALAMIDSFVLNRVNSMPQVLEYGQNHPEVINSANLVWIVVTIIGLAAEFKRAAKVQEAQSAHYKEYLDNFIPAAQRQVLKRKLTQQFSVPVDDEAFQEIVDRLSLKTNEKAKNEDDAVDEEEAEDLPISSRISKQ